MKILGDEVSLRFQSKAHSSELRLLTKLGRSTPGRVKAMLYLTTEALPDSLVDWNQEWTETKHGDKS